MASELTRRRASTILLHVPAAEWARVSQGIKPEFRASSGYTTQVWNLEFPSPAVAHSYSRVRGHLTKMMVLEKAWQEELCEISPESLAAEGCPDFATFRRRWMQREKRRFRPNRQVWVYQVRPWGPFDQQRFAELIFQRLYGEYLDG